MGEHYTSDGLLKLVAKLQTFIGSTQALVTNGTLDISDAQTTISGLIPAAKSLDDLRAELHTLANSLRRLAQIVLVVGDLGKTTGVPTNPAAILAKCDAIDLDYLVALRMAQREDMIEFYLRCRETALGLDRDTEYEPDGSLDGPEDPNSLDPPKPVDYR